MFPFILILIGVGVVAHFVERGKGSAIPQTPQLPAGSTASTPDMDIRQLTLSNSSEARWEPLRQKIIATYRKAGLPYGVYSVMPNGIVLQNTVTSKKEEARMVYEAAPTRASGHNLAVFLVEDGQVTGMRHVPQQ